MAMPLVLLLLLGCWVLFMVCTLIVDWFFEEWLER